MATWISGQENAEPLAKRFQGFWILPTVSDDRIGKKSITAGNSGSLWLLVSRVTVTKPTIGDGSPVFLGEFGTVAAHIQC